MKKVNIVKVIVIIIYAIFAFTILIDVIINGSNIN